MMPHWNEHLGTWYAAELRKAAHSNDVNDFKGLLVELLANMVGVLVPEGVLTPWPKALGAPTKQQTGAIHQRWIELEKPSLHKKTLAQAFFGKRFTTAAPDDRKKMIDRCRRAVERTESRTRLNSARIQSEKS